MELPDMSVFVAVDLKNLEQRLEVMDIALETTERVLLRIKEGGKQRLPFYSVFRNKIDYLVEYITSFVKDERAAVQSELQELQNKDAVNSL